MELDIQQTTTTEMDTKVPNFSVQPQSLDSPINKKETQWDFGTDGLISWNEKLGYWKTIPEINRPITSVGIWTAGKGFTTDDGTKVLLEGIRGWGEDTFTGIMISMIKTKKFAGDAFAEIVRNEKTGTWINLKMLSNAKMQVFTNKGGVIIRYEYEQTNGQRRKLRPDQVLHLCNDRICDEIHGTGLIEIAKWVLDAKHEAMTDKRRQLHLSTIRVMEVAEDDKERLANLRRDYAEAIKKGDVLLVPEGFGKLQDLVPPTTEHIQWTTYLENFIYQALGVPRVMATSENFTESGAKVGFLTFEPVYTNEQQQLEADLLNQLGIRITFNRPPSLSDNLKQDEDKDGELQASQPNDTDIGAGE